MVKKQEFKKIVYFDRETINNALQRQNDGLVQKIQTQSANKSLEVETVLDAQASTSLNVPFFARLKFAFSGRLDMQYMRELSNTTTVTSSDISQFKSIEKLLTRYSDVQLRDIKNSLTSLRIAAAFTRLIKTNNAEFNYREMADLLDGMEGYDLYDIGEGRYVRFNQMAYLSNYKRNDIAMSGLDLYCIKVGSYNEEEFDYIRRLNSMQSLFDLGDGQDKTLADVYLSNDPALQVRTEKPDDLGALRTRVALFDVVCAYISEAK